MSDHLPNSFGLCATTTVLMRTAVCVECHTLKADERDMKMYCDLCCGSLCCEHCMLEHAVWCTSSSGALANLFDTNLCDYYGFHEHFTKYVKYTTSFNRDTILATLTPAPMTARELLVSNWQNNTVCIDIECFFFALLRRRFPMSQEARKEAQFHWYLNIVCCNRWGIAGLDGFGTPYPINIVTPTDAVGKKRFSCHEYFLEKQLRIDSGLRTANIAYLFYFSDRRPDVRSFESHYMLLRLCGSRFFLLQAYAQHYTFAQWCDWEHPLVHDPRVQRAHRASTSSGAHSGAKTQPVLEPRPKFCGIMDGHAAVEFAITLCKIVECADDGEQLARWRAITGVVCDSLPPMRIAAMRVDLHSRQI